MLGIALLLASVATASAQVTGPLPNPPQPGTDQTANLLFQAMLAVSRASQTNPQAAQAAALSYRQAVQRYDVGDISAARAAALQALMSANPVVPRPIATLVPLPPTNYGALPSGLLNGANVAQVDADAFIAQARGAVAACIATKSPNAGAAEAQLAAAERAGRAGQYEQTRTAARTAADLCAAARRESAQPATKSP